MDICVLAFTENKNMNACYFSLIRVITWGDYYSEGLLLGVIFTWNDYYMGWLLYGMIITWARHLFTV